QAPFAHQRLEVELVAGGNETAGFARGGLRDMRLPAQEPGRRLPAEGDIDQIGPLVEIDTLQHVRSWRQRKFRPLEQHTGGERGVAEAHRPEHVEEQPVALEAIAAAARSDEFALERFRIETDRTPQHHVQVLERNRAQMLLLQRRQHVDGRLARSLIADAPEIGVEIDLRLGHAQPLTASASISQSSEGIASPATTRKVEAGWWPCITSSRIWRVSATAFGSVTKLVIF